MPKPLANNLTSLDFLLFRGAFSKAFSWSATLYKAFSWPLQVFGKEMPGWQAGTLAAVAASWLLVGVSGLLQHDVRGTAVSRTEGSLGTSFFCVQMCAFTCMTDGPWTLADCKHSANTILP